MGRLPVDDYLQVVGLPDVFAAGDVAAANGATFSLTSLRS
jgi:NADH dehydrogenase FAD-containing subunit